jgi:hypothetical protein
MNDMNAVILAKSDQVNADDLISGPMTITVRGVSVKPGTEQPVSIEYGDANKVFRPCKTVARVLVAAWGPDSSKYIGRSMTLYRDPTIRWAGLEVGGIRVSHLSHIESPMTIAVAETRKNKRPITVQPLKVAPPKTQAAPNLSTQAPQAPQATTTPPAPEKPAQPQESTAGGTEDLTSLESWGDDLEFIIANTKDPAELRAKWSKAISDAAHCPRFKKAYPDRFKALKKAASDKIAELNEAASKAATEDDDDIPS